MKFYATRWVPLNPVDERRVLVKFGVTHHDTVENRFDPSVDDGYDKSMLHNYLKLDKVLFSRKMNVKEAHDLERTMLFDRFPPSKYKVWLEDWLQLEDKHSLNDTGVTEFRLIPTNELYGPTGLINELYSQLSDREREAKFDARKKYGEDESVQ